MGPTASGKTQLAVQLVQEFPFEIVSVDSAMVYREMDIGTAKPDQAILDIAPHRLINIRDPKDAYSAAQFCQDARREIQEIIAQKKIPLLVGGTMLYFRALQQGLSDLPQADLSVRAKLSEEALLKGWPAMHERLQLIDEVAALRIHPEDSQRIQRALEVYELTGKNLSTLQQASGEPLDQYPIYNIAVLPEDRAVLHARIAERFDAMLKAGLVEEVRHLFQRGDLTLDTPAMRSVGYRQVWEYLEEKCTLEEMRLLGIIATRQLAKRQLTWIRSWPQLTRFNSEAPDVYHQVKQFLMTVQ